MNIKVIGKIPQTLKLTQISSDCVLHTISLSIARKIKKETHLYNSLSQPRISNLIELLKNISKKFFLKINLPIKRTIAKIILIIVGFKYKNIGLLKKILNPPNTDMRTAPTRGT